MIKYTYYVKKVSFLKELISIIIPVYNAQEYIAECLNSICKQIYSNFEVIVIDDASTDKTLDEINKIIKKDNRIKLFKNEKNMGCAYSRNLGLQMYKGEFITYVDADDVITEDYLEKLYDNIKKFNADISICQHKKFIKNKKILENNFNKNIHVWNSEEAIYYLSKEGKFSSALWGKMFKRKLFNKENFPIIKSASDCFILYKLLHKAKRIVFQDKTIYLYRKVMDSITHKENNINLDLVYETKKVLIYVKNNIHSQYGNLKYRYIKNLLITYNKMLFNCKYDVVVGEYIKNEINQFYVGTLLNWYERLQINLFLKRKLLYKRIFMKDYEVIK